MSTTTDALGAKAETAIGKAAAWVQAHTTMVLVFILGFAAGVLFV
ncbi:hypothetical protein CcrC1_gp075 [Caulobacter phage C1]|nr:hypothetical protein CcrC1_gp075 [Caulobacter phage C1]UTU08302.1 hypothetical protein CcrC2_gp074 [Caulobacter phage C2]UTU09377.1 hypothetical protein CcrBL47_gp091 [Caulobacter phage BL47]UTU09937.1 hypothetical protein CcrRB23_gp075 [Caulobacter phage RB23]WGN96962.1 hypothetical protein [Bertelyvirus sp.]